MRVLGSVVGPAAKSLFLPCTDFTKGGTVRTEVVRDDLICGAMPFHELFQKLQGRRLVPALGHITLKNFAVLRADDSPDHRLYPSN